MFTKHWTLLLFILMQYKSYHDAIYRKELNMNEPDVIPFLSLHLNDKP